MRPPGALDPEQARSRSEKARGHLDFDRQHAAVVALDDQSISWSPLRVRKCLTRALAACA